MIWKKKWNGKNEQTRQDNCLCQLGMKWIIGLREFYVCLGYLLQKKLKNATQLYVCSIPAAKSVSLAEEHLSNRATTVYAWQQPETAHQ